MPRKLPKDYFIPTSIDLLGRSDSNSFFSTSTNKLLCSILLSANRSDSNSFFPIALSGLSLNASLDKLMMEIEVCNHYKQFYVFNHNALWSFPRSGNHWVRFISEYLSGCPTHGCKNNPRDIPIYLNTFPSEEHPLIHVNPENPFIFYKSHDVYKTTFTSAIVLLIRDYHAHLSYLDKYKDYKAIAHSSTCFIYEAINYLELIAAYDCFGGNKMVIYYEDLLCFPEREIYRLRCFLNASDERFKTFMDNYDYHVRLSQQGKNREWLHNDDAVKHIKDHQKKLTQQDITARKNVFQAFLGSKRYQCVKPYLARYE